ncbi:MAG TPA: TraR/DksA C4-type zinc finger protein [Chloroflexota bacterium]|jgi:RNA polymerase-binding protein DksA
MTSKQRAVVDRLARKAEQLERARESVEAQAFGGDERESTGELTLVDQHPGDAADFAFQRELSDSQQRILQQEQEQVRQAIDRARAGQYGTCANCGQPIGKERMAARPEATLCIECQTRHEQEARH